MFQPGSCGIGQGPGPGDMYEATKRDVKDFCDFNSAVSCSPQCRDATSQLGPLTHAAIQLTAQFELCGLVLLTHSKDAFKGFFEFLAICQSVEKMLHLYAHLVLAGLPSTLSLLSFLTFISEFIKNSFYLNFKIYF